MNKNNQGFTIVELLVVIIVIGILAAITTVAYSGISQKARVATLQSDLANVSKIMQTAYITDGVMPTSFPSGTKTTSGVGLSLSSTTNTNQFCINGQIAGNGITNYMYYDSAFGSVQTGLCSGSTIAGSELGINKNLVIDDSFSVIGGSNWSLNLSVAGGTNIIRRAGTSSDPIENKPVLVIANTTSKVESWALVRGLVYYTDLHLNNSYKSSVWVRSIGAVSLDSTYLSVRDSNALNVTLNSNVITPITNEWKLIEYQSSALRDGTLGNLFYLRLSQDSFNTVGWSLELQAPSIVAQ